MYKSMTRSDRIEVRTCRSFFNKLLARARDGLIEHVEEFMLDLKNSSAKSSASCNIWFRGRTSRQSNIAFRRNFIMLAFDEVFVWLKRVSNMKWLESCRLFTSWKIILRSSKIASGTASKLKIRSIQVDLLVFVLDKKRLVNKKIAYIINQIKTNKLEGFTFKDMETGTNMHAKI